MIIDIINLLLPAAYLGVSLLYGVHFFSDDDRVEHYLTPLLVLTLILHLTQLTLRTTTYSHFPTASPAEVMSIIAVTIAVIYLWIESILSVKTTGLFVIGLSAAFQTVSSIIIQPIQTINPILQSPLFSLHTSSAIFGYTSIAISALYAFLYLMLFYDIKGSRFSLFYNKLPSLEILNTMNIKAATAGFVFLTLTIALGAIWVQIALPEITLFDWKILLAVITWVIFGLVVFSKRLFGWSGKRIAYFSLTGFTTIIISISLVNYFLTSFHQFH